MPNEDVGEGREESSWRKGKKKRREGKTKGRME